MSTVIDYADGAENVQLYKAEQEKLRNVLTPRQQQQPPPHQQSQSPLPSFQQGESSTVNMDKKQLLDGKQRVGICRRLYNLTMANKWILLAVMIFMSGVVLHSYFSNIVEEVKDRQGNRIENVVRSEYIYNIIKVTNQNTEGNRPWCCLAEVTKEDFRRGYFSSNVTNYAAGAGATRLQNITFQQMRSFCQKSLEDVISDIESSCYCFTMFGVYTWGGCALINHSLINETSKKVYVRREIDALYNMHVQWVSNDLMILERTTGEGRNLVSVPKEIIMEFETVEDRQKNDNALLNACLLSCIPKDPSSK